MSIESCETTEKWSTKRCLMIHHLKHKNGHFLSEPEQVVVNKRLFVGGALSLSRK